MSLVINHMSVKDIAARRTALLSRTGFDLEQLCDRSARNLLSPEERAILRGLENLEFLESRE